MFDGFDKDPLITGLQDYFGTASDVYVHFTPEFFGRQATSESASEDNGTVLLRLEFLASEKDVLFHITWVCGLHVRILLVFDAVYDNGLTTDKGWAVLRTTFDQLAAELMRDLPPRSDTDDS